MDQLSTVDKANPVARGQLPCGFCVLAVGHHPGVFGHVVTFRRNNFLHSLDADILLPPFCLHDNTPAIPLHDKIGTKIILAGSSANLITSCLIPQLQKLLELLAANLIHLADAGRKQQAGQPVL